MHLTHRLLAFIPRRRQPPPPPDIRQLVNRLINDIQVLALYERTVPLEVMADFVSVERQRVEESERYGRVQP